MFKSATVLNQNIGSWNTSSANEMSYIFYFAQSFNQDLSGWCVTKLHLNKLALQYLLHLQTITNPSGELVLSK